MLLAPLGRSPLSVSRIAFGCWQMILQDDINWGGQTEADCLRTIEAAIDAGINFFDTAEAYGAGQSEELLGKALAGRREQYIVATKINPDHLAGGGVAAACEASLRRLNTDYVDLYQIHWPNHAVPVDDVLRQMDRLADAGKVRVFGVSNYGPLDLSDLLAAGRCESNQLPFNLLYRSIEFSELELCRRHEIGVLCYSPLCQGLLTGKFRTADEVPEGRTRSRHFAPTRPRSRHGFAGAESETFAAIDRIRAIAGRIEQPMAAVALAWCLQQPGVTAVIAGAHSPEQVAKNAAAGALILDGDAIVELNAVTEPLKQLLGHNSDMWGSPTEGRWR